MLVGEIPDQRKIEVLMGQGHEAQDQQQHRLQEAGQTKQDAVYVQRVADMEAIDEVLDNVVDESEETVAHPQHTGDDLISQGDGQGLDGGFAQPLILFRDEDIADGDDQRHHVDQAQKIEQGRREGDGNAEFGFFHEHRTPFKIICFAENMQETRRRMALPMESGASGPVCSAKRGKSVSSDKASGTSDSPAVRVMARPRLP